MTAEINKLSLRAFYEKNKEDYYRRRSSNETTEWDEQYKWDTFEKTCSELSNYTSVTKDTISDIVKILQKNQKNFTDWRSVDNFNLLIDRPNGWQVIRVIWDATPEDASDAISDANDMADLLGVGKFSASVYAFILAAKDPNQFAIHRDFIAKELAAISGVKMPVEPGDKYQLLNDSSLYVGELMQADAVSGLSGLDLRALNGQDFFWIAFSGYDSSVSDAADTVADEITWMSPDTYKSKLLDKGFTYLGSQTAFPGILGEEYKYSHPDYKAQFYVTRISENGPFAFNPQKIIGEKFEALYPHNAEAYRNEGAVWNGEAFMKLMDSLN